MLTFFLLSVVPVLTAADYGRDVPLVSGESVEISSGDLRMELELLSARDRARALEDRRQLDRVVNRMFLRRQLAALAEEKGYLDDAEVQARLRLQREQYLSNLVPQRFLDELEMPAFEEEARAHYEAHPGEFTPAETVRARHILLKAADDAARERRRAEAESLLARIRDGESFGELAAEYSEDGTRFMAGDLGSFGRGQMVQEFEEAVFALAEPGATDLVESRFGFHVVQLLERAGAVPRPFEEVQASIVERLSREYQQDRLSAWLREVAPPGSTHVDEGALDAQLQAWRDEFLAND